MVKIDIGRPIQNSWNMANVKIFIIILAVLVFACCFLDLSPVWLITELQSIDKSQKLYIKIRGIGGFGSSERVVAVSKRKKQKIENDDIVFSSVQPIYY